MSTVGSRITAGAAFLTLADPDHRQVPGRNPRNWDARKQRMITIPRSDDYSAIPVAPVRILMRDGIPCDEIVMPDGGVVQAG